MNNFKLTRNKMLGNIIEFESDGSVQEIMYDVSDKIADIIEDLQKQAELGDHYKHLYSLVKKQKDDVVELIKKTPFLYSPFKQEVLRMLGERDD